MKNFNFLYIPIVMYIIFLAVGVFCLVASVDKSGHVDVIGIVIGLFLSAYCIIGIVTFSKDIYKNKWKTRN